MRSIFLRSSLLLALITAQDALGQTHFKDCKQLTGQNASLLVPKSAELTIDGAELSPESEIAAFTESGLCVGVLVWEGVNTGLALWGDDTQSSETDGLTDGELIHFRVWDASASTEYDGLTYSVTAQFSDDQPFFREHTTYHTGAIYELESLNVNTVAKAPEIDSDDEAGPLPDQFVVHESYPNPFNPTTTIPFELPEETDVEIDIFNVTGAHVANLVDRTLSAGTHTVRWDAGDRPSGMYLLRVVAGDQVQTRKLILLK